MTDQFEGIDHQENLLPYDGEVLYWGPVIETGKADLMYELLLDRISWHHDENVIFGRRIVTRRKVAWYGCEPFQYTYSGTTKTAMPFNEELLELKELAENISAETYNSCLLNLYHSGQEGMGWHSDAERDMKKDGAIASISLGAERRFLFKHKQNGEKVEVLLEHGSLLVMKGTTQTNWLHQLPVARKISAPRINLTFRSVVER